MPSPTAIATPTSDQPISGIRLAKDGIVPLSGGSRKMHPAAKAEGEELADDDAEAPGGEDRIERSGVERTDDQTFDHSADDRPDDEGAAEAQARD